MSDNEVAVIDVADELPEIEIPDLNLPSIIDIRDSVMDLEHVPDKAVIVLSLRAMGFRPPRIGNMLGCSRENIVQYIKRYDPDGKCLISEGDRRVLTTKMLQTTSIAALMGITHDKLAGSSAKDLSSIATRCATAAEKLNLSKEIGNALDASRVNSMLDALDVVAEEVKYD